MPSQDDSKGDDYTALADLSPEPAAKFSGTAHKHVWRFGSDYDMHCTCMNEGRKPRSRAMDVRTQPSFNFRVKAVATVRLRT